MAFDALTRRAFLEGAAAATLAGGLATPAVKTMSGVKLLEEEKVAETLDVQKSMASMIELDGATLLFPTSFGYFDPHMLRVAEKYPNIEFRHCGGLWNKDKHPKNTGSYFGYISMAQ